MLLFGVGVGFDLPSEATRDEAYSQDSSKGQIKGLL